MKTEKSPFNKTANAAYDSHLSKQDFRNMPSIGIEKTASSVLKDLLYFPHSWSTALGLPRTNLASSEGGT